MALDESTIIQYGPFPRGVTYSKPADECAADELYAMENCRLGNVGQPGKRKGSTPINTTALNVGATVTGIGKHDFSASSTETFAFCGNKFYEDVDGTPDDRTGAVTITAGDDNTWKTANASGTLIATNGISGDTIVKWTTLGGNLAALDVDARFTTAKHVEYWDRTAWFANLSSGVNRVWRSDQGDIETYGALNFYSYNDDITGIKRGPGGLIVHTPNSIHLLAITGDSTTPYRKQDILVAEDKLGGSESGRAIVNVPGFGQAFVRRDGIYLLGTDHSIQKISRKLDGSRYWNTINGDRLAYSHACVDPIQGYVFFWLPYGAAQTKMNHCIIFDYQKSREVGEFVWQGPDVDLTRNCSVFFGGLPHFGDFAGYVHKHETGNVDNDGTTNNAIDTFYETGQPAPYGGAVDVKWTKARHFFEVLGSYEVDVQEQSTDTPSKVHTVKMGGSYDAIGTTFAIGFSAIAGDSEIVYADHDLQGNSPFKKFRVSNRRVNEPFVFRKHILSYEPIGVVRRDKSGVY